ncbi:MAG TPA: winged helix-turn-helix domain-containing protein, partial [Pseudolabrys sp.]
MAGTAVGGCSDRRRGLVVAGAAIGLAGGPCLHLSGLIVLRSVREVCLEHGHKIPYVPIQSGHCANRFLQLAEPLIVHGAHNSQLQLAAHLLNPHIVRVRDFAMLVDHIHAVVELVSGPGGVVKPLDDVVELLLYFQLGEPFDQINARVVEVARWTIDAQISRLRKKLEADPKHPKTLKSVHGDGYVFAASVSKSVT